MIEKITRTYICSFCDKEFESEISCKNHEEICKEKQNLFNKLNIIKDIVEKQFNKTDCFFAEIKNDNVLFIFLELPFQLELENIKNLNTKNLLQAIIERRCSGLRGINVVMDTIFISDDTRIRTNVLDWIKLLNLNIE